MLDDEIIRKLLTIFASGMPEWQVIDSLLIQKGSKFPPLRERAEKVLAVVHKDGPNETSWHWTLFAIDSRTGLIQYCDSVSNGDVPLYAQDYLQLILQWLGRGRALKTTHWEPPRTKSAKQENIIDCGIFVLVNALHLLMDKETPQTINPSLWRRILASMFIFNVQKVEDVREVAGYSQQKALEDPPSSTKGWIAQCEKRGVAARQARVEIITIRRLFSARAQRINGYLHADGESMQGEIFNTFKQKSHALSSTILQLKEVTSSMSPHIAAKSTVQLRADMDKLQSSLSATTKEVDSEEKTRAAVRLKRRDALEQSRDSLGRADIFLELVEREFTMRESECEEKKQRMITVVDENARKAEEESLRGCADVDRH